MSPFEKHLQMYKEGKLKAPLMTFEHRKLDPFLFVLCKDLSFMVTASQGYFSNAQPEFEKIRNYYALQGSTFETCINELETIKVSYEAEKKVVETVA